jgi:hypothetical protein
MSIIDDHHSAAPVYIVTLQSVVEVAVRAGADTVKPGRATVHLLVVLCT